MTAGTHPAVPRYTIEELKAAADTVGLIVYRAAYCADAKVLGTRWWNKGHDPRTGYRRYPTSRCGWTGLYRTLRMVY